MGARAADFGLESLEMGIATQRAVLFDKQIPWVPASKAVNLQGSQTLFCLKCGHELVPSPPVGLPNPHLPLSLQIPTFYTLPKHTASSGPLPRWLAFCWFVYGPLWLLGFRSFQGLIQSTIFKRYMLLGLTP